MIYQKDCIGIIQEIIRQNVWNETFNACSNHHPTREKFYKNARKSKGLEAPIFENNQKHEWKIINAEKVQKVLNYRFVFDDLLGVI